MHSGKVYAGKVVSKAALVEPRAKSKVCSSNTQSWAFPFMSHLRPLRATSSLSCGRKNRTFSKCLLPSLSLLGPIQATNSLFAVTETALFLSGFFPPCHPWTHCEPLTAFLQSRIPLSF